MCLNSIDGRPCRKRGTGYKVVINNRGVLTPEFGLGVTNYRIGKWMTDPNLGEEMDSFPMGFHIFTSLCVAKKWASYGSNWHKLEVRKVQFKHVVATGKQYISGRNKPVRVIVAGRILVGEKVK